MEAAQETRTPPATPEQLLAILEMQRQTARGRRQTGATPRRVALLAGGLLLIVAGCCAALLVLQQMLSDLQRHPGQPDSSEPVAQENPGNFTK